MAIFELNIYAISNNPEVHTKLRNKIPAKLDARVWADGYDVIESEAGGIPTTSISVRFNQSADRTVILNQINALAEFKPGCEIGSFIKKHKCYHDEGLGCDPSVTIWEK